MAQNFEFLKLAAKLLSEEYINRKKMSTDYQSLHETVKTQAFYIHTKQGDKCNL